MTNDTIYVTPEDELEPGARPAVLTPERIEKIKGTNPDITDEDLEGLTEDEAQLFEDLGGMVSEMRDIMLDLQKSAEMGGPSTVPGIIRNFMLLTKTGAGELAALTGIQRLRMISILHETVDMTPGELLKIKDVMLPRYERWKARNDAPKNHKRLQAQAEKRALKKKKKQRTYDPLTGFPIP